MKCPACPLRDSPGRCLGAERPERFGFFCEHATDGDPQWLRHIIGTSALPDSGLVEAPSPTSAVTGIPLAGDLVEAATRRLGADRLARWVAARLGVDCGCEERRIRLNALDAKLRKYLGIGGEAGGE